MGRGNQGCILCAQIRNQLQLQTVLEATISSGLYPNRDQWWKESFMNNQSFSMSSLEQGRKSAARSRCDRLYLRSNLLFLAAFVLSFAVSFRADDNEEPPPPDIIFIIHVLCFCINHVFLQNNWLHYIYIVYVNHIIYCINVCVDRFFNYMHCFFIVKTLN